ncbi:MFS transporter [Conexibacter sp. DBS9H8]|uniref:MFS transporter n=1 Tax=Conexibacter sp. DBS9H8 TaxID=2937801 RepID=UPI00200CD437|nr:MFS transporter [Conexibacter sp. DBS9H8]
MTLTETPTQRTHLTATLILACLAQFMVILDVSVVNVALPAIRHALGFSEDGLQWVVNAYTITFAGFLLLGGRAADLLGRRRVFVSGLVLFSLSSLAGGLSDSQSMLVIARLIQGLGGAIIAPASLSIITTTFTEPAERNRAVGIWGAMGGAGGAAGVLLGGVLTDLLSWRWILFINLPIGLIAAAAALRLLSESTNPQATRNFDLSGALTATVGLSLLVFGIVRTDTTGWGNVTTDALIAAGVLLLGLFLLNEGRIAAAPLMPLRLFASRALSAANVIVMLVGGSTFGMWFFFSLYLQQVRGYSPLHAGLIFLPMTLAIVAGSVIASRITLAVGAKRLLISGMVVLTVGLALFSTIQVHSSYLGGMLAPCLLTSIAMPFAFIPGTITATSGVAAHEAGIASGIVNTARMFGGALGLAILATVATSRSTALLHHPTAAVHTADQALVSGFQLAFLLGAAMAAIGALVAIFITPRRAVGTAPAHQNAPAIEF